MPSRHLRHRTTPPPGRDRLLTPGEVATLFRVDPKTVTRWAAAGRIGSIRTPGGHRRFRESEVRALLRGDDAEAASGRRRRRSPGAARVSAPRRPEPWRAGPAPVRARTLALRRGRRCAVRLRAPGAGRAGAARLLRCSTSSPRPPSEVRNLPKLLWLLLVVSSRSSAGSPGCVAGPARRARRGRCRTRATAASRPRTTGPAGRRPRAPTTTRPSCARCAQRAEEQRRAGAARRRTRRPPEPAPRVRRSCAGPPRRC